MTPQKNGVLHTVHQQEMVTHFNGKTTAPWGKDMILAKRIMDKGGSNHILVSEQVVQEIRQLRKDYKFMDMGEHIVKHGEKVRMFSISRRKQQD